MSPTAATRVFALLGDPVSHSLSPLFQNAGIHAAGLDGVYVALRAGADVAGELLRGLALAGGGGNVTAPHKELARSAVDRATEAARWTGACNTFWAEDGRVCGDNTDVAGVAGAARALLGAPPAGARVLVLGAGGAAAAVLEALSADGAGDVVVHNRTPERAAALVERFGSRLRSLARCSDASALAGQRFDLVVNTTTLGRRTGDPLPIDLDHGPRLGAVLDLVYAPNETPLVHAARERGLRAADGLEMLLLQGAAAFERWWQHPAPIEAMRAALPPRFTTPP